MLIRHLLFVVGRLAEKGIPKNPGDTGVARVEAPADTPLGEVRQVLGVVAPPGAVVVPQMVERVVCGPNGEDWSVGGGSCCAHGCVMCGLHTRNPDNKKAPP